MARFTVFLRDMIHLVHTFGVVQKCWYGVSYVFAIKPVVLQSEATTQTKKQMIALAERVLQLEEVEIALR